MKKNFKRTLAKVMAVALSVSLLGAAGDADAAKKIKLAKKSITVTKGKSKKVAIKNVKAKKVKKLTVKSSKKKIATVKKSGKTAIKVTGKKKGSAKITVKVTVKGKKKATKLTLKVKVNNKKKSNGGSSNTPSASAAASAAPNASTAPQASAGTQPQPSAGVNPQPSTDVNPQPSTDVPQPSDDTQPTAPAPTAPATPEPEPSYDPTLADVNVEMTEANMPAWATSANGGYGQVTFNADGSIDYSSQPTAIDSETGEIKVGSCYNNGFAFYIDPAKEKKDMSMYQYVVLKIKTDAEIAPITWSGGGDPESFWDKKDVWGKQINTIENADGSKTVVYPVNDLFGKPAKAMTIGVTLKSCIKDAEGKDDDTVFEEKTGTIYGIYFTNKMPGEGGDEPTATPDADDNVVSIDLTKTSAMGADVTPVAAEDGEGVIMPFTKKYQSVFYDIPADVNLRQVKEVKITADIPKDGQLSLTVYNNTFAKEGEWWSNQKPILFADYPFWNGSYTERTEDGAPVEGKKGVETQTKVISEKVKAEDMWKVAGDGGYISIGSNQFVEDEQYKVLKLELVLDKSIDPVKDIVEPAAPTPVVTPSANPEATPSAEPETTPSAEPVTTPGVESGDVESGDVESGDVESGKTESEATETAAPTAEPVNVTLTAANTTVIAGNDTTTVEVKDGKATIKDICAYNAGIAVDVTLPNGKDLTDYKAVTCTLATGKKVYGKKFNVAVNVWNLTQPNEYNGSNSMAVQSIFGTIDSLTTSTTGEEITIPLDHSKLVKGADPVTVTGTFKLMLGLGDNAGTGEYDTPTVTISDIKLVPKDAE